MIFQVTAHQEGEAAFIIGTVDYSIYQTSIEFSPLRQFLRGDCNGDGDTNGVSDPIYMLRPHFLFLGNEEPCTAACDVNGDGDIGGVTDAIYLLVFNFLGGPPPVEPFPECGPGTEKDAELGCETPPQACRSQP